MLTRLNPSDLEALANPTQQFCGEEHRQIFERTKDIPGWQAEGDAFKLFELGYFAGDVILEVGVYGGRSALVELRGALANTDRVHAPQYFGLDIKPEALVLGQATLREAGLDSYAAFYLGDIKAFVEEVTIVPTMVFLDGDHSYEGVRADFETLGNLLMPGTPVLCHDYTNAENDTGAIGVRRAVDAWVDAGYAACLGIFGCSALLITSEHCQGPQRRMSDRAFATCREALMARYQLAPDSPDVRPA
jgi:hypothetical protein